MVPALSQRVGQQLQRRATIEGMLSRLREIVGVVPERIMIDPAEPSDVRELKESLVSELEAYRDGWREVEEMGAVLKDARMGLLDFYGEVDGKLVWLCWKYGEAECGHYHALEEGFASRRAIGASIKNRLLN